MSDSEVLDLNDPGRPDEKTEEKLLRAIGSPLPIGARGITPWAEIKEEPERLAAALSPKPSFAPAPTPVPTASTPVPAPRSVAPSHAPGDHPSTLQRAVNVFRAAMPYVQRIMPLLDGNVATAVSNMLAPRPQAQQMHAPSPSVDLAPIKSTINGLQSGLNELQTQNRDLRDQIVEQNASLKKVEDHLQQVREATDRNTLEQQELFEDMKSVGKKVNFFAYFALSLLGFSVLLNVALFLHIWRIIP